MSGKSEPPATRLAAIASACNVTMEWLISGLSMPTSNASNLGSHSDSDNQNEVVFIPKVDVVAAAGAGFENHSGLIVGRLPFPRSLLRQLGVRPENANFITVGGDSMEPTLADGSIVLIDTSQNRIGNDGIYVLVIDGDLRIKRAQKGLRGLTLISDNDGKYAPETISIDDIDKVLVAGKVFWSGSGL